MSATTGGESTSDGRRFSTSVRALLASCSVYLLPLIGPHTAILLGHGLWTEITGKDTRSSLWKATDLGFALVLQLIAFGLCYWVFRKPRFRSVIVVLATIPLFIAAAEAGYLVAIPSLFLIGTENQSELLTWPVVCAADDSYMTSVQIPQTRTSEPVREILVQSSKARYQMMQVPGCEVKPLSLPEPTAQPGGRVDFMLGVAYMVPGRGILYSRTETANAQTTWGYLRSDSGELQPLQLSTPAPIISTDGSSIGWVQIDEGTGPRPSRVFIRGIDHDDSALTIDLSGFGMNSSYTLSDIDVQNREVLIVRNDYSEYVFMTIGFDGQLRSSIVPDGVKPQPPTFWKLPGGWVAWDAYRENEAYRIRWTLPGGNGAHRIPLGRGITSVAANPSGTLIAVSTTTALNIGSFPDSVYVLRAGDGTEVFRRYLPRYSRSNVLFPDDSLFAYSADGKTYLLKVQP